MKKTSIVLNSKDNLWWPCCPIAGKSNCCLDDTEQIVIKFKMAVNRRDGKWHMFNVNFLLLVHNCEWGLDISEHRRGKYIKWWKNFLASRYVQQTWTIACNRWRPIVVVSKVCQLAIHYIIYKQVLYWLLVIIMVLTHIFRMFIYFYFTLHSATLAQCVPDPHSIAFKFKRPIKSLPVWLAPGLIASQRSQ